MTRIHGTHTLYHATTQQFDAFDEAFIGSNPETHINSNLGIWFGCRHDWLSGFGRRLIEADVDLGNSFELTADRLYRLSRDYTAEDFRNMRQELLQDGYDSIAIVEANGKVGMHVVLSADSILSQRDIVALEDEQVPVCPI